MNLLKYIWRNAKRNKLRSLLTICSIGFCLALMTVLYGYLAMQDVWQEDAKVYNRIVVLNKQGFSGRLPTAASPPHKSSGGWYSGITDGEPEPRW